MEFEDVEKSYVGLDAEAVALENEEFHEEMDQRLFLIMDAVINVFAQRSADETLAVEERDGLKDELASAINRNLREPVVASVSFVSLIVQ